MGFGDGHVAIGVLLEPHCFSWCAQAHLNGWVMNSVMLTPPSPRTPQPHLLSNPVTLWLLLNSPKSAADFHIPGYTLPLPSSEDEDTGERYGELCQEQDKLEPLFGHVHGQEGICVLKIKLISGVTWLKGQQWVLVSGSPKWVFWSTSAPCILSKFWFLPAFLLQEHQTLNNHAHTPERSQDLCFITRCHSWVWINMSVSWRCYYGGEGSWEVEGPER